MQDQSGYIFKPHEQPTLPGSPANPDHPSSRRIFYLIIGTLIGITSGLGNEQVRVVTAQRDALAETFRLASNRYRAGYSPYLEQLDAQRGLLAAELGLVQVRADAFTARIILFQALGGGWRSVSTD